MNTTTTTAKIVHRVELRVFYTALAQTPDLTTALKVTADHLNVFRWWVMLSPAERDTLSQWVAMTFTPKECEIFDRRIASVHSLLRRAVVIKR